jgi:c-di-GMP-binding flagellar brake protein YcgR
MQEERRQYPRLNSNVDIAYSFQGRKDAKEKSVSKNISAGGICLILYERVEVGMSLLLEIRLPGVGEPIYAEGEIKWIKEFFISVDNTTRYDAGIEFVNIKENARHIIERYVFELR